jgi:hypothetical protein
MGRPKKIRPPLPPIWKASGDLWAIVAPILHRRPDRLLLLTSEIIARDPLTRLSSWKLTGEHPFIDFCSS